MTPYETDASHADAEPASPMRATGATTTGSRRRWMALAGFVAFLMIAFIAGKVLQHYRMNTHAFDTGIYTNLVWNIAYGNGFYSNIEFRNHLGEHFSPIILLFTPIYWIWPNAHVLMIAQGLAAGLTFLLLLLLCRNILTGYTERQRFWLTAGLLVLFVMYRPFLSAWCFEFQPITLGMPLVAAAILALHLRSRLWLAVAVAALLTTRESAVLSVFGLAIYAALVLRRYRVAVILTVVAAVAAVIIFQLVMPAFREGDWEHLSRLGPSEQLLRKGKYLVKLVLPLALLPLIGWRAALAALPGVLLNLSVAYPAQFSVTFHYDAQNSVFLMVAAIYGARSVANFFMKRRDGLAVYRWAVWAYLAFALVIAASLRGRTPFEWVVRYVVRDQHAPLLAEVGEYAALPRDVGIASNTRLAPRLAHRDLYVLADQYFDAERMAGVDLVVLADDGLVMFTGRRLSDDIIAWVAAQPQAELIKRTDHLVVYRWHADAGPTDTAANPHKKSRRFLKDEVSK